MRFLAILVSTLCITHSLALRPNQAPTDLKVTVIDCNRAIVSWEKVRDETDESVRGELKGYKIQTWTDKEGLENARETLTKKDSSRALVNTLIPFSKNYIRIMAFYSRSNGPPSETLSITTPEGTPGPVDSLNAYPLGSSAFLINWEEPTEKNGNLTGYRIFYQNVSGVKLGPLRERINPITDPKQLHAKLAGLTPDTKYRIEIRATTNAGEGSGYYIELKTLPAVAKQPDTPLYSWKKEISENGLSCIRVIWSPNFEGHPGSYFMVKFKLRGESVFKVTDNVLEEDYTIIRGLKAGETYEMQVVAIDDDYKTESEIQQIQT